VLNGFSRGICLSLNECPVIFLTSNCSCRVH
jgi:hypothetical protein